jgi:hypothetical protein
MGNEVDMSVRSEPLHNESRIAWNRVASVISWLIGVLFTYLLLQAVAPKLGWFWALIIAGGSQLLLTIAERPLWRWALRRKGGKLVLFGVGVTLIDGGINAGGIFPYVPRLANTDVGKMLIEVFDLSPKISTGASALIALAIGLLVAGLSEYLWEVE